MVDLFLPIFPFGADACVCVCVCVCVYVSECTHAQLCSTLFDPMDCSLPGHLSMEFFR